MRIFYSALYTNRYSIENLQERIITLRKAGLFVPMYLNFCKRAEYCIEKGGMHFVRVLKERMVYYVEFSFVLWHVIKF